MMDHRTEPVTIEHAKLVLQTLGKFHACSFALRDKCPEKFKEFIETIPKIYHIEDLTGLKEYFETFKPLMYGVFKESEKDILQKLKNVYDKSVFDGAAVYYDGKTAEPYSVICHGDCWINNTLFKFDKVLSLGTKLFDFFLY